MHHIIRVLGGDKAGYGVGKGKSMEGSFSPPSTFISGDNKLLLNKLNLEIQAGLW